MMLSGKVTTFVPFRVKSLVRALPISLAVALASVTWLTPDHAAANCTVTTGGGTAEAPDSGATVTCTTAAPDPFTDGLDGNPAADGVTVILEAGADISTTVADDEGIHLNDNVMIELQSGASVSTAANGTEAIDIGDNGTIILGTGSTVRTLNGAIVGGTAHAVRIGDNGTIRVGDGALIQTLGGDAVGIIAGDNVDITVESGGSVISSRDDAINFGSGVITVAGLVDGSNDGPLGRGIIQTGSASSTISVLAGGSVRSIDHAILLNGGDDDVTMAGDFFGRIALGAGDDRFELQPSFSISIFGFVDGGANTGVGDTFVLGGVGDRTLDASMIGPGQRYSNFEHFIKEDASIWTLTGVNTSIDALAVNGGTLLVDGDLNSAAVTVNSGGTLGGNGFVDSFLAQSGGTVAPGTDAMTAGMFSATNATFNAGSIFAVDVISPTEADSISTTTTTLNGGTVVVGGNLNGLMAGQQYVIVDASGGVTGTFDDVMDTAFINFGLIHNPNQVLLNINGFRGFTTVAETFNQNEAAMALEDPDSSADSAAIQNALLGLSADEARRAFEAVAGGVHAESVTGALEVSEYFTEFLVAVAGTGSTVTQKATLGAPATGLSRSRAGSSYGAGLLSGTPLVGPAVWFGGFGGYADLDTDGNGGGHEANAFGLAGGVETDVAFADAVLGFAMGYSFSNLDVSGRLQDANTQNLHAGLYARMGADRLEDGFAARGALTYTHHWLETSRTIAFGAINRTAEADYDGYTIAADAEVRYNMAVDLGLLDTTIVSPFARVQLGHSNLGSFTETGAGALNLSGDADGYNRATGALGVAVSGEHMIGATIWRPTWSVAYEYAAGDVSDVDLMLAGSTTPFVTRGADESRHRVRFGTQSEFAFSDSASFIFATDSVWSEDRTDISAKAGVKLTF